MIGKIIPFPKSTHDGVPGLNSSEQRGKSLRKRRALVDVVRKAAEADEHFGRADDLIYPAQAIDRLTAQRKKLRKSARDVEDALARKRRAVRHIERLRINHKCTHRDAKQEAHSLVKKVRPYVYVLEALAELIEQPANDVIYNAFRETSFQDKTQIAEDDPINELCFNLRDMSEAVINNQTLAVYFRNATTVLGRYDLGSSEFVRSKHPVLGWAWSGIDGVHWGYEGAMTTPWDRPAFPGVGLLRVLRGRFAGPLLIEKKAIAPSEYSARDVARMVSPVLNDANERGSSSLSDCEEAPAEVLYFRDVYLVIGPRTRADDLGPLLEIRPFVELRTHGQSRPLTFPYSLAPLRAREGEFDFSEAVSSVAALFNNGWRRVGGGGWKGWTGADEQGQPIDFAEDPGLRLDSGPQLGRLFGDDCCHEFPIFWEPVNNSNLAKLLKTVEGIEEPPCRSDHGHVLFSTNGPYPKPTEFRFDNRNLQLLETALHSGAIEGALIADCEHLKSELSKRIEQAKDIRDRETAEMLARWRRLGRSEPST